MIKEIHVYDCDGVLADSTHRFRVGQNGKIDLEHWVKNDVPEKIMLDSLGPLVVQYKNHLADSNVYVVIATARVIKQADLDWIESNLGMPNKIIHRKNRNDKRKGADLKIAGCKFLRNLIQFKNAMIHFWEDNPDYLYPFCLALNAIPHYVKSEQGV